MLPGHLVLAVTNDPQLGDGLFELPTADTQIATPGTTALPAPAAPPTPAVDIPLYARVAQLEAAVAALEARTISARWARLTRWFAQLWGRLWP